MKISEVIMTPDMAKSYLDKNTHNRPLNERHVKFLSVEMQSGRWKSNGDTICLNGSRLIDGQHRLHAIVESGMAVPVILVEGLDSGVFDTKDVGRRRSAADVLAIKGEKHYALLAAAALFVHRYMTGNAQNRRSYSHVELQQMVDTYGDLLRESVAFCSKLKTKGLIASSVVAGLHFIFSKFDAELATQFFDSLIGGHDLKPQSPVYVLRERLVSNLHSKSKLTNVYAAALCIKAWNHIREGNTVKYLRWDNTGKNASEFPMAR